MRNTKVFQLIPLIALSACGNMKEGNNASYMASKNVSVVASPVADTTAFSTDAVEKITSPDRKIIKTADFNCRVTDVYKASTALENKVKALGGIVQESNTTNDFGEVKTLNYKPDSLKQVKLYKTTCSLVLRVPVTMLDSVTNMIPQLSSFVDSRNLKQSDVTLAYLSNEMKNNVGAGEAGKAYKYAKRSKDVLDVNEHIEHKQDEKINRHFENLRLDEAANYATVSIIFNQPEKADVQIVVNPEYFTKNDFGARFISAIEVGWDGITSVFLLVCGIWPLLILLMAGLWIYRILVRKKILLGLHSNKIVMDK